MKEIICQKSLKKRRKNDAASFVSCLGSMFLVSGFPVILFLRLKVFSLLLILSTPEVPQERRSFALLILKKDATLFTEQIIKL